MIEQIDPEQLVVSQLGDSKAKIQLVSDKEISDKEISDKKSEISSEMDAENKVLLALEDEQKLIVDLPKEVNRPQDKKKSFGRSPILWTILALLGGGIAFVISLPSVVGCGGSRGGAEAKTYVGSINKSQQAFWLEHQTFARSIPVLGLGIKTETNNYSYDLEAFNLVSYHYAMPKIDQGKSFVGAVFLVPESSETYREKEQINQSIDDKNNLKNELNSISIICESSEKGLKRKLLKPVLENGKPICAEGIIVGN